MQLWQLQRWGRAHKQSEVTGMRISKVERCEMAGGPRAAPHTGQLPRERPPRTGASSCICVKFARCGERKQDPPLPRLRRAAASGEQLGREEAVGGFIFAGRAAAEPKRKQSKRWAAGDRVTAVPSKPSVPSTLTEKTASQAPCCPLTARG